MLQNYKDKLTFKLDNCKKEDITKQIMYLDIFVW